MFILISCLHKKSRLHDPTSTWKKFSFFILRNFLHFTNDSISDQAHNWKKMTQMLRFNTLSVIKQGNIIGSISRRMSNKALNQKFGVLESELLEQQKYNLLQVNHNNSWPHLYLFTTDKKKQSSEQRIGSRIWKGRWKNVCLNINPKGRVSWKRNWS
jgi:hypothetical protein